MYCKTHYLFIQPLQVLFPFDANNKPFVNSDEEDSEEEKSDKDEDWLPRKKSDKRRYVPIIFFANA